MKRFKLITILYLLSLGAFAQIKFNHITTKDGLSNNSVRQIIQDKNGFLWFGTLNGLNRYDGSSFRVYKPEPGNLNSLSFSRIWRLMEDSYGYIWIRTFNNEFQRFDPRTETFLNINREIADKKAEIYGENIVETSPGILWIETKYNGLIRILEKPESKEIETAFFDTSNVLPGKEIRIFHKDKKNRIWVGTTNGFVVLNSEFVSSEDPEFVSPEILKGIECRAYCETRNKLWIGSQDKGLFYYSFDHDSIFKWDKVEFTSEIRGIAHGINNDILVTTIGQGIVYLHENDTVFYHYTPRNDLGSRITETEYFWIYTDAFGKYWIQSRRRGITLFDPVSRGFTYYGLNPSVRESHGDRDNQLIMEDSNGSLWLGLYGGGISRFNRGKGKFEQYTYSYDKRYGISSNYILSIYEDRSKNIWIGTFQGGLNKIELSKYDFTFLTPVINSKLQSPNEVREIIEDSYGRFWVGTREGSLYCYNDKNEIIYTIPDDLKNNKGYIKSNIYALLEDRYGNFWIGTKGQGLYRIRQFFKDEHPGNREFQLDHFYIDIDDIAFIQAGTISYPSVFDIHEDHLGQIWIATYNGGLNVIKDPEKEIYFTHYEHNPDDEGSISDNRLRYIMQDSENNIWIGTSFGLNFLDAKYIDTDEKKFVSYLSDVNDNKAISNSDIFYLHQDVNGRIWAATYGGGLNLVEKEKDSGELWFRRISTDEGLPSDIIFSVLEDKKGNFWMGTDNGLCKYSFDSNEVQNYYAEEGLGDNFFSEGTCLKADNGEFLFGQKSGFVRFNPDKITKDKQLYHIVITNFRVFDKELNPAEKNSPLKSSIETTKNITLRYNQNFIELRYSMLDFVHPERCQYAYYLEGLESHWNYVSNKKVATYTNLDPGKYVFRLKASNHDGFWNEKGTYLNIIIKPPYWQTAWFKFIVGLLIVSSLVGFYLMRINSLKQQQIHLQKLVKERTKEIEEKNTILIEQTNTLNETNTLLEEQKQHIEEQAEELLNQKEELVTTNEHLSELNSTKDKFFSIIAHDLKSPFNTILGLTELMFKKFENISREKKIKYLEVIHESTRNIFNLLENLLQWARTQTNHIEFEPSEFNLKPIVDQNVALMKEISSEKNISINYDLPDYFKIKADRNMINVVIRNLLSNAIKFTNNNGKIFVTCEKRNGHIQLSISDTGVGMSHDEINNLFRVDTNTSTAGTNGETGTGLGLILCKEFIEKNDGSIWVESNPGRGSKFTISLPGTN